MFTRLSQVEWKCADAAAPVLLLNLPQRHQCTSDKCVKHLEGNGIEDFWWFDEALWVKSHFRSLFAGVSSLSLRMKRIQQVSIREIQPTWAPSLWSKDGEFVSGSWRLPSATGVWEITCTLRTGRWRSLLMLISTKCLLGDAQWWCFSGSSKRCCDWLHMFWSSPSLWWGRGLMSGLGFLN